MFVYKALRGLLVLGSLTAAAGCSSGTSNGADVPDSCKTDPPDAGAPDAAHASEAGATPRVEAGGHEGPTPGDDAHTPAGDDAESVAEGGSETGAESGSNPESSSDSDAGSDALAGGGCGNPMAAPQGYTAGQRIFDNQFCGSSLNTSNWNSFVANPPDCSPWYGNAVGSAAGGPGGYDAEFFEPAQVTVNNGLSITAVSGSSQSGYSWTSGAISTCGKFQFTGGYLQIRMQQPDTSSGMWPGLWMLTGPAGGGGIADFEIDLQEGGYTGNGNANEAMTYHEHDNGNAVGSVASTGVDLSAGFHVYGLAWVPSQSLTYYLDGNQVGQITSSQLAISNEPMEVILDLQVAQNTSGWHSLAGSSTPSPSVMQVLEVQVYQ